MSNQGERFQTVSDRYARYRPRYPDSMVRRVVAQIVAAPLDPALPVLDVGSGTGIFTRQISAILPPDTRVIGVEPSDRMREQATILPCLPSVSYLDGDAEHLPVEDGSARGMVAATAAHWFDRPAFYREAARVLPSGGVLAIIEYVRDQNSPAARAIIEFLARYGEPRAYIRPDYSAELGALTDFGDCMEIREPATFQLDVPEFSGLALSSSHARRIIEDIGETEARALLEKIGHDLAGGKDKVPIGYVFQTFTAQRA